MARNLLISQAARIATIARIAERRYTAGTRGAIGGQDFLQSRYKMPRTGLGLAPETFVMAQNAPNSIGSILFITLLLAVFGCNAQKEFDREEAAKAITNSEKFRDCHMGINNRDACNWHIYTGRWETVAGYWGSSKDRPQPDSLKANPIGYWLYKEKGYLQLSSSPAILSLSDAGRTASKGWTLVALPGKEVPGALQRWEVPLAARKFVAITNVLREQRMGIQIAQVTYHWVYSLTPLGTELFKSERIPSPARGNEWRAPADLTGIDLNKTYKDKAIFTLVRRSWHLEDDCRPLDVC